MFIKRSLCLQIPEVRSSCPVSTPNQKGVLANADLLDSPWDFEPVANFPKLEYSIRDVRRAGEALKGDIPMNNEDDRASALQIFSIANSWRDSHSYPMRRVRAEIRGQLRSLKLMEYGVTAARLKRMPSIRKKLKIRPENLTQIQDLAGCRVIMPSMDDVRRVIEFNRGDCSHLHFRDWDYIEAPKADGYRSFHRVYKFRPSGSEEELFADRRVEIQFRTRLQHSWATAVEAVGLFRREDIKGGAGNQDWRRLFELMSFEFANAEQCLEIPGAPSPKDRIKEIKDINRRIEAANLLENLSQAFNYTEMYYYGEAKYFLIEYDNKNARVHVKPYGTAIGGAKSLDETEAEIRNGSSLNAVLVEADKIDALKQAYPNYFGDVQVFKSNLHRITQGKQAVEYTLPPQKTMPPPPKEVPDTAWFRRPRFRKPKGA